MCQKRAQRSLPPAPSSTRLAAGIEPTLPGTKHPCTSSILRCRCGNITATKPTARYTWPVEVDPPPPPAPAPSPPRFATAREDVEARRGAGPPCTFRYARPILNHRQKAKNHHQKVKRGIRDVRCDSTLLGVRTHLCRTEEGHAAHCTTTRCNCRAQCTLHTLSVNSVSVQHQSIGYGVRHAVRTTTDDLPAASAWSRRNWRRRGCASWPWLASSSARSLPATPI